MIKTERILYIPFAYGFNTRAKTILHKIAFFLYIVIPCFINCLFMRSFNINLLIFVLSFTGMYMVYEIGYIHNDTYTIKREEKPTHWLKTRELEIYTCDNYLMLISMRVLYVTLIGITLIMIEANNVTIYCISLAMMYFVFSLHNHLRGHINVITDGLLNTFKYLTPLLVFSNSIKDYPFFLYLFFEVPVARTLGYAIGKRYFFNTVGKINVDKRRLLYYLLLTAISAILFWIDKTVLWFLFGSIYMLLYRLACLILSQKDFVKQTRWKNEDRNG